MTSSADGRGHGRDEHEHRHRRRKRHHRHHGSHTDRRRQREAIWTFVAILVAGLLTLVVLEWGNIADQLIRDTPVPKP